MKKIKITESQLKKLKRVLNENLDMPADNDPNMSITVGVAVESHLSDVQQMINDEQANDRLEFVKMLIRKYPDTNQKITINDLDQIYNEMLGVSNDNDKELGQFLDSLGIKDNTTKKSDDDDDDENPFPDGYDFSLNEALKRKIKIDFDKYL
jgi:hypothetical protein